MRNQNRSSRARRRWRKRLGRSIGPYIGDLFTGHTLFLLTILSGAVVALCARKISGYVDDPHFALFVHWMHVVLLAADALIFIVWLLGWIIDSFRR